MLTKLESELRLRGNSEKTIKTYLFFNKKFIDFVKKNPSEVTEDDIKSYLSQIISTKSNSTAALARAALTFYYKEILGKKIVDIYLHTDADGDELQLLLEDGKQIEICLLDCGMVHVQSD